MAFARQAGALPEIQYRTRVDMVTDTRRQVLQSGPRMGVDSQWRDSSVWLVFGVASLSDALDVNAGLTMVIYDSVELKTREFLCYGLACSRFCSHGFMASSLG